MKKKILCDTIHRQFVAIPTFGILTEVKDYKFRIAFAWGFWGISIGFFKGKERSVSFEED